MAVYEQVSNVTKSLGEMRSTVYFLISESSESEIFTTPRVNNALNMGLANVSKIFDRSVKVINTDTVSGEQEYELPDPILQYGIALIDNVQVDGEDITAINMGDMDIEAGTPTGYYINGHVIGLSPIPDSTYVMSVVYRQEHVPLVNDDDVSFLPDLAINAGIMYACYLLKLKDEEYASADRFLSEYETALKNTALLQSGVYKASEVMYGGAS